jgi:hypothetical protein
MTAMSDRSLRALEVLGRSDPEYVAVASMLYGTADPETVLSEVYKAMPDQADLATQTPAQLRAAARREEKRRQRMQARVGLASNVVGLAAGSAALATAASNPTLRSSGRKLGAEFAASGGKAGGPVTRRLATRLTGTTAKGRLIRAGAIGAVGLQAANTGGDIIANRVLARSASGPKKRQPAAATTPVAKLDVRGLGAAGTEIASGIKGGVFGRVKPPKPVKMAWTTTAAPGGSVSSYGPAVKAPKAPKAPRTARRGKLAVTGRQKAPPATPNVLPPPVLPAKLGAAETPHAGKVFKPPERAAGDVLGPPGTAPPLSTKQKAGLGAAVVGVPYLVGRSSGGQESYYKRDTTVEWTGEFAKVDTDKRLAFGWASVTKLNGLPVVDKQGDWITDDDLEDAAYSYVVKSRKGGDMHRRVGDQPFHAADLVESFVLTPEKAERMGLPQDTPMGWWVGFRVNDDDAWQEVKKGNRTGFSIHGSGRRREVDYDSVMAGA